MDRHLIEQLEAIPDLKVETDIPMSRYTSFGIGGPADVVVTPHTVEALAAAVRALHETGEVPLLIGNGTNLLVLDGGVRGVVIRAANGMSTVRIEGTRVAADSGARLGTLCREAAACGLSGLEWAAGIPGTLGGALVMNAGAHGGEIGPLVRWVRVIHPDGTLEMLDQEHLWFSYRNSCFQGSPLIIAEAGLELTPADPAAIHQTICDTIQTRCDKQPVALPSAGCIFKRPDKDYAGRLVEAVGGKGMRVGGAMVSEKHANFIVNDGGATALDVLRLIRQVKDRVHERFAVELATEVCVVGEPLPGQTLPALTLEPATPG